MIRLAAACLLAGALAACQSLPPADPPPSAGLAMSASAPGATGPVRNLAAKPGEEIVTLRYFKIRKGSFPEFLKASQEGVWPFFEKIGARIVGMWLVIPDPEGEGVSADYDEAWLMTRYASLEHWSATRDAAALGGDGPDYAAMQAGLATRRALTLETRVTYLKGVTGPLSPVFLPPTGERFEKVE
jgi:hypothetical protein